MKISVISPSFNQAQFLPHNLRTVSGQTGIELEHILVDPGSTDGSLELAQAASHAILIAEPDRGQSHGITKGFERATGEVLCWLNSDDMFPSPDTLKKVADAFAANPDADIIYGGVDFVDEEGAFLRKGFVNKNSETLLKSFHQQVGIVQPGVFWRRRVFDELGGPSEDYNYCMDYEYWVRMADAGFKWVYIDETLAHHRWWSGMKTSAGRDKSLIEHFQVGSRYFGYIHWKWIDRYAEFLATQNDGVVNHAETVDELAKAAHARAAIEQFVTQGMLLLLERSQDPDHVETLAYIRRLAPDLKRVLFADEDLPDRVMKHDDPHADKRPAWCVFDTTVPGRSERYKSYFVPDNFSRHFDADWYHAQHAHAIERLRWQSENRKDTCVIVANGPSLNKSNFALLDRADVILSNYAVINDDLRNAATYLTIVNDLVATQGSVPFNQVDAIRVMPFWLANAINSGPDTAFLPTTVIPEFNGRLDGVFSWRSTVSFFNMQLAYALGYEKVALIGFDHSYQQAQNFKEGDAIKQKEEDPNHFDPRYFQGKTWQAADTGNMEKSYLLARDAYAAGGRKIVNATVGGMLEVFPRMELEDILPGNDPTTARLPVSAFAVGETVAAKVEALPRLLVIDMTPMGSGSATGQVKSSLLQDWQAGEILQLASPGHDRYSLIRRNEAGGYDSEEQSLEQIRNQIDAFDPEVILYRPLADRPELHDFAMAQIAQRDVPLVTWIMDDWPARLQAEDPAGFVTLDRDLRALLQQSALRLSICDAMSEAFEARYGVPFKAYANGIDPQVWRPQPRAEDGVFLLRYAGGLAPDMNAQAIQRVAQVVQELADEGAKIRMEINTQSWWLQQSGALFEGLSAVSLSAENRSAQDYAKWTCSADALLIAYNFDDTSMRYVRYSMANKLPECLASGAALLVHGSKEVATVDYIAKAGVAALVDSPSKPALRQALQALLEPGYRRRLGEAGRELALARHDLKQITANLTRDIVATWRPIPGFWAAQVNTSGDLKALPDLQLSSGADDQMLIVYDQAADVLAAALAGQQDWRAALESWQAQAQQAIGTFYQARDRVKLLSRQSWSGASVATLHEQFGVAAQQLLPLQAAGQKDLVLHALACQILQGYPRVLQVQEQLQACSQLAPAGEVDESATDQLVTVARHVLQQRQAQQSRATDSQLALLQEQLKQLQATSEAYFAKLTAQSQELETLQGDLRQVTGERDHNSSERQGAEQELERIYGSKSWKVTEPLRRARQVLGSRKEPVQHD